MSPSLYIVVFLAKFVVGRDYGTVVDYWGGRVALPVSMENPESLSTGKGTPTGEPRSSSSKLTSVRPYTNEP